MTGPEHGRPPDQGTTYRNPADRGQPDRRPPDRGSSARAWLRAHAEPLAAAAMGLAALWIATRGGWFLAAVGVMLALIAAGWGIGAWRRLRFAGPVSAPGVVEVDEAQLGYFGPGFGGFVSLRELVELRLMTVQGHAHWRLKQADGQALLIPVSAAGADRLYDAFATLPGIDMGAVARQAAAHPGHHPPQNLVLPTALGTINGFGSRGVRRVVPPGTPQGAPPGRPDGALGVALWRRPHAGDAGGPDRPNTRSQ